MQLSNDRDVLHIRLQHVTSENDAVREELAVQRDVTQKLAAELRAFGETHRMERAELDQRGATAAQAADARAEALARKLEASQEQAAAEAAWSAASIASMERRLSELEEAVPSQVRQALPRVARLRDAAAKMSDRQGRALRLTSLPPLLLGRPACRGVLARRPRSSTRQWPPRRTRARRTSRRSRRRRGRHRSRARKRCVGSTTSSFAAAQRTSISGRKRCTKSAAISSPRWRGAAISSTSWRK